MKKIILIFTAILSLNASNAQYNVLEADYNDNNEIVAIVPDKSWSKSSDNQLPEIFVSVYSLNTKPGMRLISTHESNTSKVYRYQQTQNGYDVEGGEIIIRRLKNNEISAIIGRFVKVNLSLGSIIKEDVALNKVVSYLGKDQKYLWKDSIEESFLKYARDDNNATYFPKGKLVYSKNPNSISGIYTLCYQFEIYIKGPKRIFIYINAINGTVENEYNAIHKVNGTGTATYHGNVNIKTAKISNTKYYLHDSTIKLFTSSSPNAGSLVPLSVEFS